MTRTMSVPSPRNYRDMLGSSMGPGVGWWMVSLAVAVALALIVPTVAAADFTGSFDVANWTITKNTSDGTVDTSSAPASITIIGPDNNNVAVSEGFIDFTITVAAAGTWSFDWQYDSADLNGFDNGGFLLFTGSNPTTDCPPDPIRLPPNGICTQLADNASSPASGSVTQAVTVGETIGFRVWSFDRQFGPGELTISNFSAPEPTNGGTGEVPAPSALALLAVGAVGVGLVGRRKRRRLSK